MDDVVIVSGARTAIGKFQGAYSNFPASDSGRARHPGSSRARRHHTI